VHRKVNCMVALFAGLLPYGNETGDFCMENVIETARGVSMGSHTNDTGPSGEPAHSIFTSRL